MTESDNPVPDLSRSAEKCVEPAQAQTKLCAICLLDQAKCAGQSHTKLAVQARSYTLNKLRSFGKLRLWLKYLRDQENKHQRDISTSSSDTTGDVQRFDDF